jgi:hypothetical protein
MTKFHCTFAGFLLFLCTNNAYAEVYEKLLELFVLRISSWILPHFFTLMLVVRWFLGYVGGELSRPIWCIDFTPNKKEPIRGCQLAIIPQ